MRVLFWVMIFGLALPAQAALYKWVDVQGRTHYSDTLPQQATGRANVELDKQGLTVRQNAGTMTPEQRQLHAAEQARLQQELQTKTEQKRRDTALLNTYTTPAEIDLARDRNLEQAKLTINSNQIQLRQIRARQAQLDQQMAVSARDKRPIPAHVTETRDANAREIVRLEGIIAQKRKEMTGTRAKFDADKARFIELTGTTR
ncbi:hypothetical protein TPL01_01610 [Sulfuriferula plumbiphila]|uniref:DUF4124 domain-containing protein n=1 Tax=Sulfuriferula plumbiphila TaxID=171865 RepID=A0A512L3H7_9PROT|nr:DUF4124 domain-containing protein [Sulfuriferula plumbiphila]BBP02729.1 hypothetical protein SFPGR_01510 [Sulfuriferula plumbiphila]GEP29023.1 hypothetical protein TPL01_01610 [Sulfuriferula plumbiphila]